MTRLYQRDRVALKYDVERRNHVHRCEHAHDSVQAPSERSLVSSYPQQHQGDAELDGYNGDTVEYLEEEKPLEPRLALVAASYTEIRGLVQRGLTWRTVRSLVLQNGRHGFQCR